MHKKIGPFILLTLLLLFIVFIIGTRYGQRVGAENKYINFVMSITPTPSPLPTSAVQFKSFANKGCGLQFLIPNNVKADINSSAEARLGDGNGNVVEFSCAKNNDVQTILTSSDPSIATEEVQFQNQKLKARTNIENNTKVYYFQIKNPLNGKQVTIGIDKGFFPLFERTLEFTR